MYLLKLYDEFVSSEGDLKYFPLRYHKHKKNGFNITKSIRYYVKWGIEKEPCLVTQAIHSPSIGIHRTPLMTILVTVYQCSTDETPTFSQN